MQKERLSDTPPNDVPPGKRTASSYSGRMRAFIYIFLLFILLIGGALAYGYSYFENNIQAPLVKFFHPVSRGNNEPPPDDSAITGRPWNILLLGSDNDNKYTFPALLTQVMMVVHVDPDNNSVYMISIPRDSWVYMSLNGGMHKIDQAFLFGAAPHNNFDDGVRAARQTIEQDYGITIDRYAWVGLSGFASAIDTLGGVDIDVTETIKELEQEMLTAANNLEFEKAGLLRDQVRELKRALDGGKPAKQGKSSAPPPTVSYRKAKRASKKADAPF